MFFQTAILPVDGAAASDDRVEAVILLLFFLSMDFFCLKNARTWSVAQNFLIEMQNGHETVFPIAFFRHSLQLFCDIAM
ncbi:hypothetical protein [Vibrio stylophorae]|uniref:hypothetical protein n=1 Tax=Vibrio stylophorae TaxID=659351 RepID=UPI001F36AE39|nr:hypothetical protein [Vibrio stylophorae]